MLCLLMRLHQELWGDLHRAGRFSWVFPGLFNHCIEGHALITRKVAEWKRLSTPQDGRAFHARRAKRLSYVISDYGMATVATTCCC